MIREDEMDRLLMIPGPTPVDRHILSAMAEPTIAHTSTALAEIIRECQRGLRAAAGTNEASPFIFAGSGTLAQEAAVVNIVAPGDHLLVVSNGYFGDRFAAIAQCHGIEVDVLHAPWGSSVTADQVHDRLAGMQYAAVTVTHVDTSTGVAAPVEELVRAARTNGALVILDSVCALGGMPVAMDDWGVDIVLTGAQKALGVPPGLALLLASPRAMERRSSLARVPSFYADLANWAQSMNDPQIYFSTHAVNLFYGLREAFEILDREGLQARFDRHRTLSHAFREGMYSFGFRSLAEPDVLAPTLSVLAYPEGIDDASFRECLGNQGVVAAGCLGEFKGRGLRFGHMGNITDRDIFRALLAVGEALEAPGGLRASGDAIDRARSVLNA